MTEHSILQLVHFLDSCVIGELVEAELDFGSERGRLVDIVSLHLLDQLLYKVGSFGVLAASLLLGDTQDLSDLCKLIGEAFLFEFDLVQPFNELEVAAGVGLSKLGAEELHVLCELLFESVLVLTQMIGVDFGRDQLVQPIEHREIGFFVQRLEHRALHGLEFSLHSLDEFVHFFLMLLEPLLDFAVHSLYVHLIKLKVTSCNLGIKRKPQSIEFSFSGGRLHHSDYLVEGVEVCLTVNGSSDVVHLTKIGLG